MRDGDQASKDAGPPLKRAGTVSAIRACLHAPTDMAAPSSPHLGREDAGDGRDHHQEGEGNGQVVGAAAPSVERRLRSQCEPHRLAAHPVLGEVAEGLGCASQYETLEQRDEQAVARSSSDRCSKQR